MDTMRVGQAETVAHSIPQADLVQPQLGLARQCVEEGACGRRPTGGDGSLGFRLNLGAGHEALVVVLLHAKAKAR